MAVGWACETLYFEHVVVESGGALDLAGCPIYAHSADIEGQVVGEIVIVPGDVLCPGDVTGNGEVDINDVLMVLGNYLCEGDCEGDADDDGIVDINDVLQVLGDFGGCG